jgi:pentalenolactone synthase
LVICELLGVPYEDRDDFRRWSDQAAHIIDTEHSHAGLAALWNYMRALVDRKRRQPGRDVISELLATADQDPDLSSDGIAMLAAALLFAGHETTVTAIDRGVALLLTHPDQYTALQRDPSRIAPAVEEVLRSSLPVPTAVSDQAGGLPRYAHHDIDFGGVSIAAGELVLLGLQGANHDHGTFPEPHRFDTQRTPNQHLSFGHGPRFCIGAPLARIELRTLLTALPQRLPTLRLAVPAETLRSRDELLTGGLVELPVTW